MTIKLKLIHQYRDVVDHWDNNPFQEVEESFIDEATHTVKNVCIFGTRHSKNGYTYQDPAINTLTRFAEGARFYINHPSKTEAKERDGVRDIRDWAGIFSNPRKVGADKVYSDLTVRPAYWELVKDVATMKPMGVGNSINSRVKIFKDGTGKEHVVDIDQLRSIDLVASAATTQNLFESAMDKVGEDLEARFDSILEQTDRKIQGDMVYALLREVSEGVLTDKLKEREVARKVNELNWKASDLIDSIIRDEKKKMDSKKKEIGSILEDLDSEITKILSGKTVDDDETETHKEEEMDFTKLTLEDLIKERPDLVKDVKASVEGATKLKNYEEENTTLKKVNEDLAKERDTLKTQVENLTKELNDVKKSLDEYQAKEKMAKKEAFITEKVAELKLPKEAMTEFFKSDLMLKDEEEILEALKDRVEIFSRRTGGVKNAGDEYTPADKGESLSDQEIETKKKAAKAALLKK